MSERMDDRELQETFAALERDLPRVEPRADLLSEIVARTGGEGEPAAVAAQRPRRRLFRPGRVLAGATAVAAVVIAFLVLGGDGSTPAAEASLVAHGGSGAHGDVRLFEPDSTSGRVELDVDGLASAPPGQHYTVWVLRKGSEHMTPIGSFGSAPAGLELPLPGAGDFAALDISLQEDDAPPVHSGVSVAGAEFAPT